MPHKTKEARNAYHKVYQLARYHRRRAEAIKLLGGKCVRCGSTVNLDFDHINKSTKNFTIAKIWSASEKRFTEELAKCQLLCRDKCHYEKSIEYKDYTHGPVVQR